MLSSAGKLCCAAALVRAIRATTDRFFHTRIISRGLSLSLSLDISSLRFKHDLERGLKCHTCDSRELSIRQKSPTTSLNHVLHSIVNSPQIRVLDTLRWAIRASSYWTSPRPASTRSRSATSGSSSRPHSSAHSTDQESVHIEFPERGLTERVVDESRGLSLECTSFDRSERAYVLSSVEWKSPQRPEKNVP